MALAVKEYPAGPEAIGTLARALLAGASPREVLENVEDADWTPDGQTLAVVRDVNAKRRLELPEGKVLYETGGYLSHIRTSPKGDGLVPGAKEERELSWLDWSAPLGLSEDGLTLLFSESGEVAGEQSRAIYMRKTDGSPAIRLGGGRGLALSPDGKTALAFTGREEAPGFLLLPIGPGTTRSIPVAGLTVQLAASYFPDGRRIAFVANEAGRGGRLFVLDTAGGGAPRAISSEGVTMGVLNSQLVSPDGRFVAAIGPTGAQGSTPWMKASHARCPGCWRDRGSSAGRAMAAVCTYAR